MPWFKLELYSLVDCFQNQLKTSLILNYLNNKNALKLILFVSSNKKRERENQSCYNIFAFYYISPLFIFIFILFLFLFSLKGIEISRSNSFFFSIWHWRGDDNVIIQTTCIMPTTFFFPFFSAGLGWVGSTWCTQILTTRTRSIIFFITFLFISCVCDGLWGVAKRQEFFFLVDGKGNTKSNRIETRKRKKKRHGSLSSSNGVAKAKEWEESNVCTLDFASWNHIK